MTPEFSTASGGERVARVLEAREILNKPLKGAQLLVPDFSQLKF